MSNSFISWFELASYITTILGIPIAILVFLTEKRKDRRQKELMAYLESNDRYMTYLDKVFENPDLDCGEFKSDDEELLKSGFTIKQITLYTQLMLILENGWYVYHRSGLINKKSSIWKTWEQTYKNWVENEDFRRAWHLIELNTPSEFGTFMSQLVKEKDESVNPSNESS